MNRQPSQPGPNSTHLQAAIAAQRPGLDRRTVKSKVDPELLAELRSSGGQIV